MTYEILPCRVAHIRELARTMRSEDREEIELVGLSPRHLLHDLWRSSLDPKAALIDGEVAAVWGDNAPMLARQGSMWLFTAPIIARLPLAYFREARRDIRQRLEMREVLHAHVACTYERSLRFFEMLGFTVGEPIENALFREIRIERCGL
jgi:hypothetical protein